MQPTCDYDLELGRVARILKAIRAKRVLLQAPDGIKPWLAEAARWLEREAGVLAWVSGRPSYGACDLALDEARKLGADALVHFGHPPLPVDSEVPVIFIPARIRRELLKVDVGSLLRALGEARRVGLEAVIQFEEAAREIKEELERSGVRVLVGGSRLGPGIVTGCDYAAALAVDDEVDVHVIVASGLFHAIGLRLVAERPVVLYDPLRGEVVDVERELRRMLAIKLKRMAEALDAETFGVIVCTKSGQLRPLAALRARRMIEDAGRRAVLLVLDEITPERLSAFAGIDAFVNTGCPRLSLDDQESFDRPVLTPYELRLVLEGRLEEYRPRADLR